MHTHFFLWYLLPKKQCKKAQWNSQKTRREIVCTPVSMLASSHVLHTLLLMCLELVLGICWKPTVYIPTHTHLAASLTTGIFSVIQHSPCANPWIWSMPFGQFSIFNLWRLPNAPGLLRDGRATYGFLTKQIPTRHASHTCWAHKQSGFASSTVGVDWKQRRGVKNTALGEPLGNTFVNAIECHDCRSVAHNLWHTSTISTKVNPYPFYHVHRNNTSANRDKRPTRRRRVKNSTRFLIAKMRASPDRQMQARYYGEVDHQTLNQTRTIKLSCTNTSQSIKHKRRS